MVNVKQGEEVGKVSYHHFFWITLGVLILDQVIKAFIVRFGSYVTNTGAGFSIFQQQTVLLSWISLIVIGSIIYILDRLPSRGYLPAALIVGGATGNLIDRVVRGHVIDFIDLKIWPVFNLADIAISIGALWLAWLLWFQKVK
ncbi:signal peptidase II [Candidatus Woesearchaeota archaeon]|nr:signal peptidase II [Candidatus Woesearchaeota archaeon]